LQSDSAADKNIIGQTIRLNNFPMTVIGISQPGFYGVDLGYSPQIMVPVTMKKLMTPNWDDLEQRRTKWVEVYGRLKPGVEPGSGESLAPAGFQGDVEQGRAGGCVQDRQPIHEGSLSAGDS